MNESLITCCLCLAVRHIPCAHSAHPMIYWYVLMVIVVHHVTGSDQLPANMASTTHTHTLRQTWCDLAPNGECLPHECTTEINSNTFNIKILYIVWVFCCVRVLLQYECVYILPIRSTTSVFVVAKVKNWYLVFRFPRDVSRMYHNIYYSYECWVVRIRAYDIGAHRAATHRHWEESHQRANSDLCACSLFLQLFHLIQTPYINISYIHKVHTARRTVDMACRVRQINGKWAEKIDIFHFISHELISLNEINTFTIS